MVRFPSRILTVIVFVNFALKMVDKGDWESSLRGGKQRTHWPQVGHLSFVILAAQQILPTWSVLSVICLFCLYAHKLNCRAVLSLEHHQSQFSATYRECS